MGSFSASSSLTHGKAIYTPEFWKRKCIPYNVKFWDRSSTQSITYTEDSGVKYSLAIDCDCKNQVLSLQFYVNRKIIKSDEFGAIKITESSCFYAVIDKNKMNEFVVLDHLGVQPVGSFASPKKCFEIIEFFLNAPTQKPSNVEWIPYDEVDIPEELYM